MDLIFWYIELDLKHLENFKKSYMFRLYDCVIDVILNN